MKPGEEKNLRAQLDVMRILGDNGNDYLFLWEFQTGRMYFFGGINKRYPILENGKDYCTVEEWCSLIYEKDRPALRKEMDRIRQEKETQLNMDYRLVDREKNRVWVNCRGEGQVDEEGELVALVGRVSDTALEQKVDQLTGAFNGSKLAEDMKRILDAGLPSYLLLVGVDNFKHINIRHGREYGSQLLCAIVDVIEEIVGAGVRVYRVNGDCFAVNLFVWEKEEVEHVYQQLRSRMAEYCTISAGVVSYHEHQNVDVNSLYQYAEETLDKAKRMGKDTMAFFSPREYQEKLSNAELQEELRRSVQDGFAGFSICYQPQLLTGAYELFGAEALLRYTSPTRGKVSPAEFIPILEQIGAICQVGLWTLKNALAQCQAWRKDLPDMHISVNVSYTQLSQKEIDRQVLNLLEESGLPGDALTLEVTESIQLQDFPHFNRLFYQWKQAGIEISVDDFGTGYSSLSYLKNLDIDEVKIDRCFVTGIQHSAYNFRLLKNMIELACSSKIRVCCEGVETREELMALEELNPDLLQGFYFNRPLTPEEFERTYIRRDSPEYQRRDEMIRELKYVKWEQESLTGDIQFDPATMENIVEALDDIVYVSDPVTYEIYYLNPAGQRLTGVHDYEGRKCYRVLQGKDSPCEFCNNKSLREDRFQIWEWENEEFKRRFIIRDKLILWHGKQARLEVAMDISRQEVLSTAVQEKLDFAENMLICVKALAEEPDMRRAVRRMLAAVVDFYQADRAYIFEPVGENTELWSNTFEWCRKKIMSQRANLQRLPFKALRHWKDMLERDETLVIPNVDDLRESEPQLWKILHDRGSRSLLAVPIQREGKLVGALGVDNPRHCSTDESLIRMLTLFVVNRFVKDETEERLGELLNLHYRDVLKNTELGLWFIRIDPNHDQWEMFADKTMQKILGLEKELPPQECFQYWYERINDSYYQYVNLTVESMIRSDRVVQLEYPWCHPTLGEVMVRCIGVRGADTGGMICLEGYHRILSNMDRPQFLPDTPTGEVFEYQESTGEICFHTGRTLLAGEEKHELGFPQCWLEKEMVHPHFVERFTALFQNVKDAKNVDHEEILLRSKQGNYDWFRLRTRHLEAGEQDRDTILVLLDAADPERLLQLENMRIRDFYHASLGEAIAYAEVDLESDQLKASGGLWASYEQEYPQSSDSLLRFMMKKAGEDIQPNQKTELMWSVAAWTDLLSQEKPIRRFRYQRKIHGEWRWVELVAHKFQEQLTENEYALLYLKDIDVQVRKEHAQQEAASRDPLTGIYNRNAFKRAVLEYMNTSGKQKEGVLILLDIDNFKTINDQLGHLEGDEALQYITERLKKVFRQEDILGRLGGDEFMVFLKGNVQKEVLNQRMDDLYYALEAYSKFPITCSAGIAYVQREQFSYQESLLRADMALYQSKQGGKCNYTYAEQMNDQIV